MTVAGLSHEATTALSNEVTDASPEGVGIVWPGSGLACTSGCVGVAELLSRKTTTALSHEVTDALLLSREATTALSRVVTDAPLLSREVTTALSHGVTDAIRGGRSGMFGDSLGGSLSREVTTALSCEVTDAPGCVRGGRQPRNGVVRASGLKKASAMPARAAAGRGAVGARVAV